MVKLLMGIATLGFLQDSSQAFEEKLRPVLSMPSPSQFAIGKNWTWTYFINGDLSQPYSAETYTVVGNDDGKLVTFEIQSRYDDSSESRPHTRFRVNLTNCFKAFKQRDVKLNFMIALFPLQNGKWATSPIWSAATAFEEKFNCNPVLHEQASSLYKTLFGHELTPWGSADLFQQRPKFKHSQIRSYYFSALPGLTGVAYRKAFNPNSSNYYEMRLTDFN